MTVNFEICKGNAYILLDMLLFYAKYYEFTSKNTV